MGKDKMSLYCAILVARMGEETGRTYMAMFHVKCMLRGNPILDLACTVSYVNHGCAEHSLLFEITITTSQIKLTIQALASESIEIIEYYY